MMAMTVSHTEQVQYGLRLNRAYKDGDMDALMSLLSSYMLNAGLEVEEKELLKFYEMNLVRNHRAN